MLATDTNGIDVYPCPEERTWILLIAPISCSVKTNPPWCVLEVTAAGVLPNIILEPVSLITAL